MSDIHENIAYLNLAANIVETDYDTELYITSMFPDATSAQIASIALHNTGILHKGIMLGLEISDCNTDPISVFDAFEMGVAKAIEEQNRRAD